MSVIPSKAVAPLSMIMRKMACFYCEKSLMEGALCKRVSFHFGIIHCDAHSDEAIRDVHAYMHKNHMVRLTDAFVHPKIKPLFDLLTNGVYVKRSSGLLDPDWRPLDNPYDTPNLIQKLDGDWYCTFYKGTDLGDMHKSVALTTFFDLPDLSPSHKDCLTNAILAMDEGIYKEQADKQDGLPVLSDVTELPGVQTMIVGDKSVRVLVTTA